MQILQICYCTNITVIQLVLHNFNTLTLARLSAQKQKHQSNVNLGKNQGHMFYHELHTRHGIQLYETNALKNLVHQRGYSPDVLHLQYDHPQFIGGLVTGKRNGDDLKLDRHKYVKHAVHCITTLSKLSKDARGDMHDHITHSRGLRGEPRFPVSYVISALLDDFLFSLVVAYNDVLLDHIEHEYVPIHNHVAQSGFSCVTGTAV